jgi:hypothetical protein
VQRAGMRPLQFLQARPALQQIPYQGASYIPEPLKDLREIQFQAIGQTIALPRFLIYRAPPRLHQELQQAGFGCVRPQLTQPFAMTQQ